VATAPPPEVVGLESPSNLSRPHDPVMGAVFSAQS
jgi:hypothetical protein